MNSSWLSTLARPGALLAQRSTGLLVKVFASAEFAFLGITIRVEDGYGGRVYVCHNQRRESIKWHHVTDLSDWCEVHVTPCLTKGTGTLGPLGWQPSVEKAPLPLEAAAFIFGHTITYEQMKELIKYLGGDVPRGTPSKRNTPPAAAHYVCARGIHGTGREACASPRQTKS